MTFLDTFFDSARETLKSRGNALTVTLFLGFVARRFLTSKPTLLISDLKQVGHVKGEPESSKDEFDIIIVGGGKLHSLISKLCTYSV